MVFSSFQWLFPLFYPRDIKQLSAQLIMFQPNHSILLVLKSFVRMSLLVSVSAQPLHTTSIEELCEDVPPR